MCIICYDWVNIASCRSLQNHGNIATAVSPTPRNTPIEQISNTKSLGIHIDSSLTWDVQVSHVKKIVIYKLFLLKRIRHFLPNDTRILFYNFYIKSIVVVYWVIVI